MKPTPHQKKEFAEAHDLAALEEKVDGVSETVNKTLEEVQEMKTRMYLMPTTADIRAMLSPLISDNRKIKAVIKDKLHVEV